MRNFANLFITFIVFYVGSTYYSDVITIQDTPTLLAATVLVFVIGYIYAWLFILSLILIPLGVGCLIAPALWIGAIFITPIKLWLLSNYLPGFHIEGFWTYVILSVVLNIFMIKVSVKNSNNEN